MWRRVRFDANACGCVIMMWDLHTGTDPRKQTAAFVIRLSFLWSSPNSELVPFRL
jgi:hypothetical protein